MSNVSSEFIDYENTKLTMTALNEVFTSYDSKLTEINNRIQSDINAGADSALDTPTLGANACLSWNEFAYKFKNFKETFDYIYRGVAEASNADEAFENAAKMMFNSDGTVNVPGGSTSSTTSTQAVNNSYSNLEM